MEDDELKTDDSRVEFIAGYLMKTLKLKREKWLKMYAIEENKKMINNFLENIEPSLIVFYLNTSNVLTVQYQYPLSIKSKVVYFGKKNKESIQSDVPIQNTFIYGDLSTTPIDQFSTILDEVIQIQLRFAFKFH
jgi:dynein heavy chain, axonemal